MRTELKQLARLLHDREMSGSRPEIVRELRNKKIKELFEKRQKIRDEAIAKIDASIEEIRVQFNPPITDDVASLSREMRLSNYYSSIPTNKLAKVYLKACDIRDLSIIGATARKRGLHELADTIYETQEVRRTEWQYSPFVKDLEKLKVKIELLHNGTSPDSLYIGENIDSIDKTDFADVSEDGTISFKDETGTYRV